MIPISVRMKGWMRYRDEQTADFGGGRLIAICGQNGAGKSSIFDAITFALYGRHRLGRQRVEQLISEDMDYAAVDFEFEVDGERYLVHRGRGRKAGDGKQSLYIWDEGGADWAPVPGTEKEDALERAIRQITRLSYEAFTSSFMLQQGEATAFIDAEPKPRFEILSSLIGLEAYRELEKRAREAQRAEKQKLEWISEKLGDIGDLDEPTIAQMRMLAEKRAREETDAAALAQAAKAMLSDAQRYCQRTAEITKLEATISRAEELLAQRDEIENAARMYDKLSTAMGMAARVRHALADASRAEAAADEARQQAAAIDIAALASAQDGASRELKQAVKRQHEAEKAEKAADETERTAHDFATLAAAILEGRASVASFDQRVKEIDAELKKLSAAGRRLETDASAAALALEAADVALDTSRKDSAGWRARADELKRQLAERKAAAKEATCSRCGQPIDRTLAKAEVDSLTKQLGEAQAHAVSKAAEEQAAAKARAAAKKNADEAASSVGAHAQRSSRLEGERTTTASSIASARTALAEREGQLNGRMKDVESGLAAHATAAARLGEARLALAEAAKALDAARDVEKAANQAVSQSQTRLAGLDGTVREQSATAALHRRAAEEAAAGLGDLRDQALEDPAVVERALSKSQQEVSGAAERKIALDKAQESHTAASAQREAKLQEIEAIPQRHRVDETVARQAASEAASAWTAARAEYQSAQNVLATAEARLAQASELRADADRATLRHKRLRKLTTLLGKNGLQGALVADALDQVSSHANAFLKQLTGGTLQLSAERSKEGDALELKAIDSTCMREPHPVKVLSGSQKFRCAVAIASGIGQYAGAGGMRSIVIDEGFASLDQESQKTMVRELQGLSEHMDKVIVVSHLEAFTDPANFPDQIHVETHGNASVISRGLAD